MPDSRSSGCEKEEEPQAAGDSTSDRRDPAGDDRDAGDHAPRVVDESRRIAKRSDRTEEASGPEKADSPPHNEKDGATVTTCVRALVHNCLFVKRLREPSCVRPRRAPKPAERRPETRGTRHRVKAPTEGPVFSASWTPVE